MKIITLLAQKGGTGKTTLSIHLAVLAAAKKLKVVIADIDPQQSTTFWNERRADSAPDVIPLMANTLEQNISKLASKGVNLLVIDTAPHP